MLRTPRPTLDISLGRTRIAVHPGGGLHAIEHVTPDGPLLINNLRTSPLDAPLTSIWLRPLDSTDAPCALVRPGTVPRRGTSGTSLHWSSGSGSICAEVSLHLAEECLWIWRVELWGHGACILFATQDLGLAARGAVLANELYVSQYIGHTLLDGCNGRVVASRQNMPQEGRFPGLHMGSLDVQARACATDGLDFFGRDYPYTRVPAALTKPLPARLPNLGPNLPPNLRPVRQHATVLPDTRMQGEWGLIALESAPIHLDGHAVCGFYGLLHPDHPEVMDAPEQEARIAGVWDAACKTVGHTAGHDAPTTPAPPRPLTCLEADQECPYLSPEWDHATIARRFPVRCLEEYAADGTLLAFFTPLREHVVLQAKDRLVQRPHGHIVTTSVPGPDIRPDILSATHAMHGQFGAQITVGNTSLHKLTSAQGGLYDALRLTGTRLWVRLGGVRLGGVQRGEAGQQGAWRQLSLPAACIFDLNSTRWFYDLPDGDVLAVSSRAVPDRPELVFEAVSEQGRTYELCLTFQMVMGEHAWLHAVALEQTDQVLTIRQPADLCDRSPYPELRMDLLLPEGAIVGDDRVLRAGDGAVSAASSEMLSEVLDPCLLTVCCTTSALRLDIRATLDDASSNTNPSATPASPGNDFATAQRASHTAFAALTADFTLEAPARADADTCRRIEAINTTVWWYAHNAMIHYAAPHGIEQPGGAAWGTRDVCQGPLEFFLAFGQHARARATLLRLFAHQSAEHGEWPQWFMFDRYRGIFAQDCHGDVVFWPLFALAQYLEATHDAAILDEPVPFAEPTPASPAPTPLRTHVVRALAAITPRLRTVNGQPTALVSYAGGDWDDTLQPAHAALKERLVSAWTQALASQTMARLGSILLTMQASADAELAARLTALGAAMAADFHRYLICDGVIAGFASLEDDGLRYLLHPRDTTTGIKYRLLPLTRSIIAGLADRMLTARNIALMDAHLAYPDGMRLMDRPARYQGGISHIFQRAEQAAHVGREISLQYVHAHIRYLEAMCAAGEADRVWEGLFAITPPVLREHVPHAGLRQSNAYFSSSDGAYPDRYVYQDTFDRLRRGDIAVNGGWRVYSSGPGIYIRQVVQGLCGVRRAGDKLVLDPTLPLSTHTGLDGLALRLDMPDLPPLRIVWTLGAPPAATPPAASVAIHTAYCNGQPVAFSRLPDLPCRLHARGGISLPVACLTPGTDGICTLTMELK